MRTEKITAHAVQSKPARHQQTGDRSGTDGAKDKVASLERFVSGVASTASQSLRGSSSKVKTRTAARRPRAAVLGAASQRGRVPAVPPGPPRQPGAPPPKSAGKRLWTWPAEPEPPSAAGSAVSAAAAACCAGRPARRWPPRRLARCSSGGSGLCSGSRAHRLAGTSRPQRPAGRRPSVARQRQRRRVHSRHEASQAQRPAAAPPRPPRLFFSDAAAYAANRLHHHATGSHRVAAASLRVEKQNPIQQTTASTISERQKMESRGTSSARHYSSRIYTGYMHVYIYLYTCIYTQRERTAQRQDRLTFEAFP